MTVLMNKCFATRTHGISGTYDAGCRCNACRAAGTADEADRYQRRKVGAVGLPGYAKGQVPKPARRPVPLCKECFLEHNGDCA